MGQYVLVVEFIAGRGEGGRTVLQNHDLVSLSVKVRTDDLKKSVAEDTNQHISQK